jgi:hypothetical protein
MSRAMCVVALVLTTAAGLFAQGQQAAQQIAVLEARLRSPLPNDRIGALGLLKKYPQLDVARPVLQIWNRDADQDVRMVAGGVLFGWRSEQKLRKAFLDILKKDLSDANAILVAVCLAGASADERGELLDAMARVYEKRPLAVQGLMPITEFLGTRDDPDAAKALSALTKLAVYQKHFGFRRSVIQGLIAMQRREAVTVLVDLLGESDGEIQGDIAIYLTRIGGQPYGLDAKAWKSWWLSKQADFEFPPAAAQKARQIMMPGLPAYYGIPVFAKKVIFVIDTSGSMRGSRIANAKVELKKVVEALPSTTQFNIVAYSDRLDPWNVNLQPSNPTTQGKARAWIERLSADGATHTYDALKIAMDQQPEAVYVLTDGKPTGGTLVEPKAIVEALKQNNKYRRTTVHVIGLDPGPEDGAFSKFLQDLAGQNYGQYRRVD